jgi:glyoxylase-like metal-dependent hydrolase (beta-lactamase superfamily II)
MHLQVLSERVRIIAGPVNVGVLVLNDERVALIDTGFDRRYGRKILELLNDLQYQVAAILNTHAHADHMGGNAFIHRITKCPVLAGQFEAPAIQNPRMQAIALFGGYPVDDLMNHSIVAEPSPATIITEAEINLEGTKIQVIDLPGHSIGQKGFLVDGIAFLGDSLFSLEVMKKHRLIYLYNPIEQLETLKRLETLVAKQYVAGHFPPVKDIKRIVEENRLQIERVFAFLRKFLVTPQPLDRLVKEFLGNFGVKRRSWEHFLYRSTLNGFLSAMKKMKQADFKVIDNLLVWFALEPPRPA